MSQARKLRRTAAVKPVPRDDETPPMARVGMVAGISLGLSDEQSADALNALAGFRQGDGTSAAMFARMLELVDLARLDGSGDGLPELDTTAERAKLERRFGVGFVKRVAAMGQPAASMLGALRGLLIAVLLMLWPAKASANELAETVRSAHKIQRRNRGRRRAGRRVRNFADTSFSPYHHPGGWTRSNRKYADSPLRSTFFRSSETGCGCVRASSKSRAKSSTSSWFGVLDASTLESFPRVTPTSRFNGATERSKARLTAAVEK